MANFWFKLKLWTKSILAGLLVLYVILFTYRNAQEKVVFWYWFGHQPETNLLLFVLCTFFAGVLAAIIAQMMWRTLKQVREMKMRSQMERLDRDLVDRKAKAAMLQTRDVQAAPPVAPVAPPLPIESLESRRQV
jgi:lysylphosphatidylglycerol synthetase-like protein (DUF2156 family)